MSASVPTINQRPRARNRRSSRPPLAEFVRHRGWTIVAAGVLVVAVGFVVVTEMRPQFDAYGWLVWGRQALHGNLDLNSAPSWKPLPFLFTFAYAPTGHAALWLWMVTAVAGALAGPIFAARIAYRLTGPAPGRLYAPWIAAVFGALGLLGIEGYWHLVLVAATDPLDVTLCLAAIDCHLSRRPRAAWVLLVLASLGRPEAWPLVGLYGAWAWRTIPSMRKELAVGLALVPVLWFGVPWITTHNPLIAGQVALDSTKWIRGNRLSLLVSGFAGLYEFPMALAGCFAVALAVARRERTWLVLAGLALIWLATEAAFALHGWNPSPRYMFEPAAVLIVLAGASIGWLLAVSSGRVLLRLATTAMFVALVVSLAPHARIRGRLVRIDIVANRVFAHQAARLHSVIVKVGGTRRILACGRPVTDIAFQSILAWDIGENVADIGFDPSVSIARRKPIVLFEPDGAGWKVRPIHGARRRCRALSADSRFSWILLQPGHLRQLARYPSAWL